MADWREYDIWLTPKGSTSKDSFHATDDCTKVKDESAVVPRSEGYMAYHDPEPCPWCHDDIETPQPDGKQARTPLRDRVGDGDE